MPENLFFPGMRVFTVALLSLFVSHRGLAQTSENLWKEGMQLSMNKDWAGTVALLKPHLFPPPEDSLQPALLQLFALASWRLGDYPSAMATCQKVLELHPNWPQRAEALYLRGEMEWSKGNWRKALNTWSELPAEYGARVAQTLDRLPVSVHADTLIAWKRDFGSNPDHGYNLWSGKKKGPDINLARKGMPKVGIVLPFGLQEKGGKTNSSTLDFYRGMLLANEVCTALDSGLEFHAFDLSRQDPEARNLISQNALLGLDLMVGPWKTSALPALASWAATEGIPLIQPVSPVGNIGSMKGWFGQQPGFQTMARECFSFISKTATGSKYAIFFGPERNDSLMAEAYREHLSKMGRQLTAFKKVGKNSAANLTKFLLEADLDSTCHVFVPNNEPLVRVQLMSAYGWLKAKYPVLVLGKWLEAGNTDYDEFVRNPVYFVNPDLPDYQNTHWQEWQSSYLAKYGTPPNWVSWKGFDLVLFLSRQWYGQSSTIFSGNHSSELFGRYHFSSLYPDNQYVPIYKMDKAGIQRIWPEP